MDRMLAVAVRVVCGLGVCSAMAMPAVGQEENWRLAVQAYSFNRFTFYEAVEKTRALGIRYIEAYPTQLLSKDTPGVLINPNLPAELRTKVREMLKDKGVKLVNYGVVGLPNNEQECRKVFDFAREMGIETIVSEPPEDAVPLIDKLCHEYGINVAIHDHPRGQSFYWDPNIVLKVCQGRSRRIGACADTGHWMRSGIDPLEAIKKLAAEGRIISLHLKDLNEFGTRGAHDVPWGTGLGKVHAVLEELARQKFKGVFSIEYEYNWLNSMPEIALCEEYFERTASELGVGSWQWIFNGKDLTGWDGDPRLWSVKDGAIHGETTAANPAANNTFCIWRGGKCKDFELRVRFRIQNGNSGVQYRSKEFDKWRVGGYQAEVANNPGTVGFLYDEQGRAGLANVGEKVVIDSAGKKQVVGKVADVNDLIKAGYYKDKDWNEYDILCRANRIVQILNGYPTVELVDNDRPTDPADPKGRKGSSREGLIALQIHTGPPMVVEFKDIRIRPLGEKP